MEDRLPVLGEVMIAEAAGGMPRTDRYIGINNRRMFDTHFGAAWLFEVRHPRSGHEVSTTL